MKTKPPHIYDIYNPPLSLLLVLSTLASLPTLSSAAPTLLTDLTQTTYPPISARDVNPLISPDTITNKDTHPTAVSPGPCTDDVSQGMALMVAVIVLSVVILFLLITVSLTWQRSRAKLDRLQRKLTASEERLSVQAAEMSRIRGEIDTNFLSRGASASGYPRKKGFADFNDRADKKEKEARQAARKAKESLDYWSPTSPSSSSSSNSNSNSGSSSGSGSGSTSGRSLTHTKTEKDRGVVPVMTTVDLDK